MHPSEGTRWPQAAAIASLLVLLSARPTGAAVSCLQLALQLQGTLAPCLAALQSVLDGATTAAAAASSISGATLQGCCSGLATFNTASCLCDATVASVITSAVPSAGATGLAPLVASTCGGLQLRMMQPNGTCGVAATPPVPPPPSRPPPMPPTPTVAPSTHAPPPPANSSAPVPAVPPPLPPAVVSASGPPSAPLGLLAAAEVLIQLALAQQLASPPPPPAVQPGTPPAQHSSAGRPAHPVAHALGVFFSALSALHSLG
jgi:hypothetical protein